MNLMGESLGNIRYHEGFLTRQVSPISNLAFHPRQLSLAMNTGSSICIYRSDLKPVPEWR